MKRDAWQKSSLFFRKVTKSAVLFVYFQYKKSAFCLKMAADFYGFLVALTKNKKRKMEWTRHWILNDRNNFGMTVMTLCWLCDDFAMTLQWLCDDFVMTLWWLCDDFVMTLLWLCQDFVMTYEEIWLFCDESMINLDDFGMTLISKFSMLF